MTHETAGDPMSGLKWTRRTTEKIAAELQSLGISVGPRTVARLLTQLGFSLRVNQKKRSTGSPARRNEQFEQIASLRERFVTDAAPIISVDTKKKELVGHFKNAGVAWNRAPVVVNDHDFRSEAEGIAIQYCTQCRWLLRAAWMLQELLVTFELELGQATLVRQARAGSRSRSATMAKRSGRAKSVDAFLR